MWYCWKTIFTICIIVILSSEFPSHQAGKHLSAEVNEQHECASAAVFSVLTIVLAKQRHSCPVARGIRDFGAERAQATRNAVAGSRVGLGGFKPIHFQKKAPMRFSQIRRLFLRGGVGWGGGSD